MLADLREADSPCKGELLLILSPAVIHDFRNRYFLQGRLPILKRCFRVAMVSRGQQSRSQSFGRVADNGCQHEGIVIISGASRNHAKRKNRLNFLRDDGLDCIGFESVGFVEVKDALEKIVLGCWRDGVAG